jgi:ankyrin repeat protein
VLGLDKNLLLDQLRFNSSSINHKDWLERTPLMWAALRDDCETVKTLLLGKANVNASDNDGSTALHMAARRGCFKCVLSLLEAGASPASLDHFGNSPLHDAAINRTEHEARLIIHTLSKVSDLEARNKLGSTPLYYASNDNEPHSVSALISEGADVNTVRYDGNTPLVAALRMNNLDIVEILCKNRATLSWSYNKREKNIIDEVCLYGSIEAMNIIAETPTEQVEYDPEVIFRVFKQDRQPIWEKPEEELFSRDNIHDAFQNFLNQCGIPKE